MIFFLFLSLEHLVTFPSVKQLATSVDLFGIYPDSAVSVLWNPASGGCVTGYSLDFVRLSHKYANLSGYRIIFPVVNTGRVYTGSVISLTEQSPGAGDSWPELYEHNRGEVFLGYTGSVGYGISLFVDRNDWWYRTPWREGYDYVCGVKLGMILGGASVSVVASRDYGALASESIGRLRYSWPNCGVVAVLSNSSRDSLDFLGAYHVNRLSSGTFIKALKVKWIGGYVEYLVPLALHFRLLEQLEIFGGYTLGVTCLAQEVGLGRYVSMGFAHKCSSFTTTVSLSDYPLDTSHWEVGFHYER